MERGQQATGPLTRHQAGHLATLATREFGSHDPVEQARRCNLARFAALGLEPASDQLARQRRLPYQLAITRPDRDRCLAEGVKGAAGLLHLTRVLYMGRNAGEHLGGLDRLGHIVGTTGGKRSNHMLGFREPGHEDERDRAGRKIGLESPRDLEAVHAGHQRIEQHDIGQALARARNRALAVGGDQYQIAGFVERIVQQREVLGHVVDDQHDACSSGVGSTQGRWAHDSGKSLRHSISRMASNWN